MPVAKVAAKTMLPDIWNGVAFSVFFFFCDDSISAGKYQMGPGPSHHGWNVGILILFFCRHNTRTHSNTQENSAIHQPHSYTVVRCRFCVCVRLLVVFGLFVLPVDLSCVVAILRSRSPCVWKRLH